MHVVFHPRVHSDLSKVMDYYERVATRELADEFYREFRSAVKAIAEKPQSVSLRKGVFRRVNLRRFPYHFLFRILDDSLRVLVVRHHYRRPTFGTRRR